MLEYFKIFKKYFISMFITFFVFFSYNYVLPSLPNLPREFQSIFSKGDPVHFSTTKVKKCPTYVVKNFFFINGSVLIYFKIENNLWNILKHYNFLFMSFVHCMYYCTVICHHSSKYAIEIEIKCTCHVIFF